MMPRSGTEAAIWLAMFAWTIAISDRSRWAWTAGFILYILHIFAAYQSHYSWSHEVALAETARQTAEVTGWESGVGLYVNYAFALILGVDLAVQWFCRTRIFPRIVDGFVFFMMFNGAVVFGGRGAVRVIGAVLCLAILVEWIKRSRENSSPAPSRPG